MRNNVYSDIMLIQEYAITCIWKKNENFQNFQNFMYSQTCLSGHLSRAANLPIVTTKIDSHGETLSV